MHYFLHSFVSAVSWLASIASALGALLDQVHGSATSSSIVPAAAVVSSVVVAVGCASLALLLRARLIGFRRSTRAARARIESALLIRDAVIAAGREAVAVLNPNGAAPLSFSGGSARLDACLRGPEAAELSTSLTRLVDEGIAFSRPATTPDGRRYAVRGCAVGGQAAIFFREDEPLPEHVLQKEAVLNTLPFPVWIRGGDLSLRWANHAFLAATAMATLERAAQWNVALGECERDLAKVVQRGSELIDARRHATIAGQQRALAYTMRPLANGDIAAVAIDVTDSASTDHELKERAQLEIETMNLLSTAVAIFERDRRLVNYNAAYARIWELSELWLDTHPTLDDILDRLREARRLPERRDFAGWKRDQLKLFERAQGRSEELWHLASGRSLRVEVRAHSRGGLVMLYDDITDRLRMESAFNGIVKVQKAILDSLHESIAVFGPDGRLKAYNAAFARQWLLAESELAGEPHLNRIADLSAVRVGPDEIWEIVRSGVASSEPERANSWGTITRGDGKAVSVSLSRLPDGSTLVAICEASSAVPAAVSAAA